MRTFEYTITDEVGIHARPAGLLVKEAKKLMALMGLGVKKGDTVTVSVEGGDEDTVAAKMEKFFRNNL